MVVVSNTSPISNLALVERLELLRDRSNASGYRRQIQVPDIGSSDDGFIARLCRGLRLRSENHVSVESGIWSSLATEVARRGPVFGGLVHDLCAQGQVSKSLPKHVKPRNALSLAGPDQLAANLVIGDFGNYNVGASDQQCLHPPLALHC